MTHLLDKVLSLLFPRQPLQLPLRDIRESIGYQYRLHRSEGIDPRVYGKNAVVGGRISRVIEGEYVPSGVPVENLRSSKPLLFAVYPLIPKKGGVNARP